MKTKGLVILAAVLLLTGLICLWTGLHGTVNLSIAWPVKSSVLQFAGSVKGWRAIAGASGPILGVIVRIIALVSLIPTFFQGQKKLG